MNIWWFILVPLGCAWIVPMIAARQADMGWPFFAGLGCLWLIVFVLAGPLYDLGIIIRRKFGLAALAEWGESSLTSVIQVAGRTVGYVQTDIDSNRLYLRNIALHPDAQGQGIGTCLVNRLQQEAEERGIPVNLSVFHTNPRAQDFYKRLGFRRTGQTDTHIEMSWHAA